MAAGLLVLLPSCARIGNYAEEKANHAAYGNIRGAQISSFGESDPFTINSEDDELVRALLHSDRQADNPELLSLADALAIAMANSRSYQTRKENLFIQALNLTEVQKDFNWDYSASVDSDVSLSESFGNNGVDTKIEAGMKRTLASGATITLDFTQNLVNYFTNPDGSSDDNSLSFKIIQPLLNGFGPLVTMEPLRQAERSMVYTVRDFKRFQQDFVIEIASEYYSVLRTLDQLNNERKNYESSISNREQSESYAKAGRIADFEAAQARQSELNAADRWTLSRSSYQKALDDFRFTLGLPVDLNVEANPDELKILENRGLVELDITLDAALENASSNRLDLVNSRQQVEDKERNVEIQQRNFLPKLGVTYDASKALDPNSDVDQKLNFNLNLPFDWTEKRNDFRIAQISLDREKRSLEEDEDDVQRSVRDLWRKLERNRSVYQNRLLSVRLSERRVENTTLLLKQGKALTRDLLDAEDDLLSSKNEATAALVDYTINRLRFWDAIERFEIDPKGMWYEQQNGNDEGPVATP
ncbi:MAG: TolC family protein [Pontiella sp.]